MLESTKCKIHVYYLLDISLGVVVRRPVFHNHGSPFHSRGIFGCQLRNNWISNLDRADSEYQKLILNGAGVDISLETADQMFRKLRRLPYDFALYEEVIPILDYVINITSSLLPSLSVRSIFLIELSISLFRFDFYKR